MERGWRKFYNALLTAARSQHQVAHGGLFKEDDVTLDDIRAYDRNRQPPEEGVRMCLFSRAPL